MKASPKKLTVCKFGVTVYPNKEYRAEPDGSNHIRLQVCASAWIGFLKSELIIK